MASTILGRVFGIVLLVLVIALAPAAAQDQVIKVSILGTGTPLPIMKRFGPSTLVEAGREKLLFDSGRGVAQRLYQLNKMPLSDVNPVFLTHLHSDHVVGLPDLWLTGWLVWFGGRRAPLRVLGPVGTKEMTSYLEKTFQFDIQIRGSQHAREGAVLVGEDIKEGEVYNKGDVKVTAFNVNHGNVPTFGYRIDYGGHSVVISGDTTFSENLIKFSKGVDLLIHEVLVAGEEELPTSRKLRNLNKFHTIPEQAGEVFTRVKPKLAVFTHIQWRKHTMDDLIALTRRTYSGPLEVGEDLLTIEVGEKIELRRLAPSLPH